MKTNQQLDIVQIWEQFHKTRSEHFRNLLMEHYAQLVKYAAERLHSKLPDKVEVDDLISAGIFGLMDAIDAFDPARGVKFETYCSPRIKGSILDELRSMDWVPRLVRARAHQLTRATQSLETHLGRKPTEKETAEELNMNMEEFNRLQRDANAVTQVSLNTKYSNGDSRNRCNQRQKERGPPDGGPKARPEKFAHEGADTCRTADCCPVLLRRDDDEGDRRNSGFIRVPRLANALIHHGTSKSPVEQPQKGICILSKDSRYKTQDQKTSERFLHSGPAPCQLQHLSPFYKCLSH
jgi:FliA/WhiG family RNA polymerase sigma factor